MACTCSWSFQHCFLGVFLTKLCSFCDKLAKKVPWSNQDQINDFHQIMIKCWWKIRSFDKKTEKFDENIYTNCCFAGVVQWIQMFTKIWSRFVEYLMKSWSIFLVFLSKKYILDDFCWFSLSAVTSCKTCFLINFFVGCSYRLQICYRPRNFNVFWQLLPADVSFFAQIENSQNCLPWL